MKIASTCSLLHRIANQQRVWETLRKRTNLVVINLLDLFDLIHLFDPLCLQVTVSREVRHEVERRSKRLDMKESPVDTLRNSFLLCHTLRNNWASGLLK